MSPERKDDASPVTWGELRQAIFLTTKFCVTVASAASYTPGFNEKAENEIKKAAKLAVDLNGIMGAEIVEMSKDG